jgi:hypothetical protein
MRRCARAPLRARAGDTSSSRWSSGFAAFTIDVYSALSFCSCESIDADAWCTTSAHLRRKAANLLRAARSICGTRLLLILAMPELNTTTQGKWIPLTEGGMQTARGRAD